SILRLPCVQGKVERRPYGPRKGFLHEPPYGGREFGIGFNLFFLAAGGGLKALKLGGELLPAGGEADTAMGGHAEAIARRQEDAARCRATAEFATVASIDEPRKGNHAARGTYPAHYIGAIGKKRVEEREIALRDLSG